MKVISLIGGPGSGKSTCAAGLFSKMKLNGYNVELVTEYAKDLTWDQRFNCLTDQLYVTAEQNKRLNRLKNKVEYIVTDTSLLLALLYKPENYYATFDPLVMEIFNSYENYTFFINRIKNYVQIGRKESEEEAIKKSKDIVEMLAKYKIPYSIINGNEDAPLEILSHIKRIDSEKETK